LFIKNKGLSSEFSKVPLVTLALMLTVVFLSLFEAGFDHNVVYWVVIMLSVVTLYTLVNENVSIDISYKKPFLWYSLFLLWAGLSIFWSINPHRTLVEFIQLSLYWLVFLLATTLTEDSLLRLGRITLITASGVAMFGISQFAILVSTRMLSTFTNPNPLGIYLVMIFMVSWGYHLRKKNIGYYTYLILIILVALILTASRGSFICFFISLPFLFIGFRKSEILTPIIKTVIFILVGLIIAQCIVYVAPYLQNAIGSNLVLSQFLTRPESFIELSGLGRLSYWITGSKIAIGKPINGYGLGTFFMAYFIEYDGGRWYSRFAHNHFVQTAAELGFIGLSLLIGFFLTLFRLSWVKIVNTDYPIYLPGLIAAALAFFVNIGGDYSWNFPGTAIIFFIIAGLIVRNDPFAIKIEKKQMGIVFVAILLLLAIWQLSVNLMYSKGIKLDYEDDIKKAAEIYDLANKIYPFNSMAYVFAGNNYYLLFKEEGREEFFTASVERFKRAVELSPYDANIHNRLAWLYWDMGDFEAAEKYFNEGVRYAAYRLKHFNDLAWFYLQQEKNEDAINILNKGIELQEAAIDSASTKDELDKVTEQIYILEQLLDIAIND
jgi:O-antigen ligase